MFRTSQGPSSGGHNLFLTEVTGFCVRCQCLAAYLDPWCVCLSYRSRLKYSVVYFVCFVCVLMIVICYMCFSVVLSL
jgi:hypothetical protein